MARARVILQSDFPYHITGRCINKEWFHLPMRTVWSIFSEELKRTNKEHDLKIHSFVLMSNHFHLLASTPQANISQCMHQLMSRTSRRLTKEGNRINETFAGRHFKCILNHQNYYLNAYKYNYRNPVEAGIVTKAENYKFSTLFYLKRNLKLDFNLIEDSLFLNNPKEILSWINTPPDPLKLEGVRYGLKKPYFASKNYRPTNKPLIELGDLL